MLKERVIRLLILLGAFIALTQIHAGSVLPLSISVAQILFFPFVIAWCYFLKVGKFKIPRTLLYCAVAGGLIGTGIAYGPPSGGEKTFSVARLPADPLETDSR